MLICIDTTISNKYQGNINVTNAAHLDVSGMVNGDITVMPNSKVTISGVLNGGLIIEENANVIIFGRVNGGFVSNGGTVTIFGVVDVNNKTIENAIIKSGAIVNGIRY